ncbi:hypothetical protein C8Q74DRAFT_1303938 [Fomes fomentarius]|nr:hypothetical protein C8Q74DRAFT_1303938 [Fomes fomentarius]
MFRVSFNILRCFVHRNSKSPGTGPSSSIRATPPRSLPSSNRYGLSFLPPKLARRDSDGAGVRTPSLRPLPPAPRTRVAHRSPRWMFVHSRRCTTRTHPSCPRVLVAQTTSLSKRSLRGCRLSSRTIAHSSSDSSGSRKRMICRGRSSYSRIAMSR